jgi:hypothetical protein
MKLKSILFVVFLLLVSCAGYSEIYKEVKRINYKIDKMLLKCTFDTNAYIDEALTKNPPKNKQDIEEAVEDAMTELWYEQCGAGIREMIKYEILDEDTEAIYLKEIDRVYPKREAKVTANFIKMYSKQYKIK